MQTGEDDDPPFWRVEERLTEPSEPCNEVIVPETSLLVLLSTVERDVSTRASSALTSAWVAAWVAAALAWMLPTAVLMVVTVLARILASWALSCVWVVLVL